MEGCSWLDCIHWCGMMSQMHAQDLLTSDWQLCEREMQPHSSSACQPCLNAGLSFNSQALWHPHLDEMEIILCMGDEERMDLCMSIYISF